MSSFLVIMAGGSGTRFWPKSTARRPKQLLSFGDSKESLLAMTLKRFEGIVPKDQWMIVTTELLADSIKKDSPGAAVLAEPQARNTAPCVYWAAREVASRDPKAVMMVMPADHFMAQPEKFSETVKQAVDWASKHDDLVTLGAKPTRPETGYGYLKMGSTLEGSCRKVDAFVEKPDLAKAQEFIRSGNYLWNGGMFLWRAEVILKAFDQHMPEMKKAWDDSKGDARKAYPKMTATSIDFGVMEKAKNVVSFPLECGWDDVGSWTSLEGLADLLHAKKEGGTVLGGETIAVDSTGNIVDMPGHVVTLLGVKDLIIVEQGDTILIADKSRAQDIKLIVERIKKTKPELA